MSDDKSKYLGMSSDIDEMRYGDGKSKVAAGFKMFGKGIFNTGVFAVTELLPGMVKSAEKQVEKNKKR